MKKPDLTPRIYPGLPGDSRRTKARKRATAAAPVRPEGVVEPARYDVMRASAWEQGLAPSTRPGANDYKRIASRGLSC